MSDHWNDNAPIYKQIRDRVARAIMDGSFKENEAVPSVRAVAAESKVNHLTVSKAYQELVDQGVLETRRGLGMFVLEGARNTLLAQEREAFSKIDLPQFIVRAESLGFSVNELIELIQSSHSPSGAH